MSATTTGPPVSVVIPTYNDDEFLSRAVESALTQAYEPLEILLIDSSDSPVAAKLSDGHEPVRQITTPPNGPGAARNVGIDDATGEYIAFLDADDEWLPGKLAAQIEELEVSNAAFAFSEEYVVSVDGAREHVPGLSFPEDEPPHEYYFRNGTGIGSRTVVVRSDCLEHQRFDEELDAREDPHLWTRLLREYRPVKIPEPLAVKHARADSLTADPELVWQNERRSIEDLTARFDELEPYRTDRLTEANYRCAKRLLGAGKNRRARTIIRGSDRRGPRMMVLLGLSYLPVGHGAAVDGMDAVYRLAT